MSVSDRFEAGLLRAVMALPPRVQRRLAGPPVVLDGQTLATETQLMLRLQEVARLPAAETLPIPQGRISIDHQAAIAGRTPPIGSVRDLDVGGRPGRLYTPSGSVDRGGDVSPLLVFFHGGGFMYGGLASHDASCRVLAEHARLRVLAVDYRMGPEDPFPAGHDDAIAAYRWVVGHVEELGADADRLVVGGDSAGGTLAAWVALSAAREGLPLALQVLIYPAVDAARATRSYELFGAGFFLTSTFMELANTSYFPGRDTAALADPLVSPLYADVPAGLAPVYVVTAGFDPLRDEGEAYARKLADAGVRVELRRFADQIHGFFNVVGVGRIARGCVEEIAAAVRVRLL